MYVGMCRECVYIGVCVCVGMCVYGVYVCVVCRCRSWCVCVSSCAWGGCKGVTEANTNISLFLPQ